MTLDDYYKKTLQMENEKIKNDSLILKQFQTSPNDFKVKRKFDEGRYYLIIRKSDGYKLQINPYLRDDNLADKINALIRFRHLQRMEYLKEFFKKLQWWKK